MLRVVLAVAALAAGGPAFAADDDEPPGKVFPVVPDYGGVYPGPKDDGPRKGLKVVFDVTEDGKVAGTVVPALERVALLYNLAGRDGVASADVRVAVVLHGAAAKAALSDAAYHAKTKGANPNADLLRHLTKAGATVYVCGQSLARNGYEPKDVRGEVKVVASALTAVVNRQADGYGYVPAH